MNQTLPFSPLTTEALFERRDQVDRSIGIAIERGWHRMPEFHADLDQDAAERKSLRAAIWERVTR